MPELKVVVRNSPIREKLFVELSKKELFYFSGVLHMKVWCEGTRTYKALALASGDIMAMGSNDLCLPVKSVSELIVEAPNG